MNYKTLERSVGAGMEFVPVIRHTNGLRELTAAVGRLLLLIAFGYATVYVVRAVFNL